MLSETSELKKGSDLLIKKIKKFASQWLVVLGIDAYKTGFQLNQVKLGKQEVIIDNTKVWLLPNPSGLNAHYSLEKFTSLFKELRKAVLAGTSTTSTAASTTTS